MAADPGLIFDVGAHTGDDSDFYLKKGFRVVAVEAFPPHAAILRERFADKMALGQFSLEEVAIGDRCALGPFYVHATKDDWHRATPDPPRGEFTVIEVNYVTFDRILSKYCVPYYLKVDIEGNDKHVIEKLSPDARPTYVSFEFTPDWRSILEHLHKIGYKQFQVIDQSGHQDVRAPFPAREGRYVDARFHRHTSGLFGRELPSRWVNYAATVRIMEALPYSHDSGQWFDVHAHAEGVFPR